MKNLFNKATATLLTATTYAYVSAATAFAGSDTTPTGGIADETGALANLRQAGTDAYGAQATQTTLQSSIGIMIRASFSLIGIVLVVIFIYAGFTWMTAGGSEEKITKAKKMLTNAVIGLVITMLAYSIANFVLHSILKGTSGV